MASRHKNKHRSRHRTHPNKPAGIAQNGRRVQAMVGATTNTYSADTAAAPSSAAATTAPAAAAA